MCYLKLARNVLAKKPSAKVMKPLKNGEENMWLLRTVI